jgi:hypothetical protein
MCDAQYAGCGVSLQTILKVDKYVKSFTSRTGKSQKHTCRPQHTAPAKMAENQAWYRQYRYSAYSFAWRKQSRKTQNSGLSGACRYQKHLSDCNRAALRNFLPVPSRTLLVPKNQNAGASAHLFPQLLEIALPWAQNLLTRNTAFPSRSGV